MKRYDMEGCSGFCEATIDEIIDGEYVKHDEAHAILKEAYEAVVGNYIIYDDKADYCIHCNAKGQTHENPITHKEDCIVLKADKWLKENT